jgi:catechol 2,3-dioxygenase
MQPVTTPSLQLRSIELRVSDLARSLDFYTRQLGFARLDQMAGRARLAAVPGGPALLTLVEDRGARHAPMDSAGLFHAALLLPDRVALGGWIRHAAEHGVEFDGFSDHGVSEAVYLADPDGNGLEFYADRPRDKWPQHEGAIAMFTHPLDVPALLATNAKTPSATPLAGARWGHLHLRVTRLDRSAEFYRPKLGLAVTQDSYPGALFLAADNYHHHLGLNTWSHPRTPRPPAALGLAEATFAHAGTGAEQRWTDPDGIAIRLVAL